MAAEETKTDKTETRGPARKPEPREARTSSDTNAAAGRDGVGQEVKDSHEARTTVPGASNVDARLDNRTGADRPPLEAWPAKPQQVDGPDVAHQVEHTRRVLADRQRDDDAGRRKGMHSPGPHGLSDESLRRGGGPGEGETLYGTEGLTEAQAASGAPKADI